MSCIEYTQEQLERQSTTPIRVEAAIDPMAMARSVARMHGVDVLDLLGPRRLGTLPMARRALYAQLRAIGWSYPQIARFVGRRHHTTVLEALRTVGR